MGKGALRPFFNGYSLKKQNGYEKKKGWESYNYDLISGGMVLRVWGIANESPG